MIVAPLWKLLPLINIAWSAPDAGYDGGERPLIDGAAELVLKLPMEPLAVPALLLAWSWK